MRPSWDSSSFSSGNGDHSEPTTDKVERRYFKKRKGRKFPGGLVVRISRFHCHGLGSVREMRSLKSRGTSRAGYSVSHSVVSDSLRPHGL